MTRVTPYIKLILLVFLLSSCGYDPLTGVDSPSGEKIAFVYIKKFNKSVTHVSIVKENESLPRKGNVAVFRGLVSLTLEWENENKLRLVISDSIKEKIVKLNKKVGDVEVILD